MLMLLMFSGVTRAKKNTVFRKSILLCQITGISLFSYIYLTLLLGSCAGYAVNFAWFVADEQQSWQS